MSYPTLPCKLSANASLLRPIALWSLDTFEQNTPVLIGVEFTSPKISFHPVVLAESNPFDTLAGLLAPPTWDVLVVVIDGFDLVSRVRSGVIAHCVDRSGQSATEMDDRCGRRRSLYSSGGILHTACLEIFGF